jgi:H+/Cl- antiporter ClcA/CBS domain-containing protein
VTKPPRASRAHVVEQAETADGAFPIAPSLAGAIALARLPRGEVRLSPRVAWIGLLASGLGLIAALIARLLGGLISLCTNLCFFGRLDTVARPPYAHHLGAWVVVVPVLGALLVGAMARWGTAAIRGHGIPEAMEQVLVNESRISVRVLLLKPLSAAISIGSGGPFGAEGPIIATGGALGSVLGQWLPVSDAERKTLLAAGAAAGMAATFGTPLAAVLLAIELLLFELDARSFVPVALAAATATAVRLGFEGAHPAFAMPTVNVAGGGVAIEYVVIGAIVGLSSIGATRVVYAIEDAFDRLPIHWMWWPALGGLVVGVVGLFAPRTLGVGYDNIEGALSGSLAGRTLLILCVAKLVSWSIALGSGTSGGTLAPLLTIGGGLGALLAEGWQRLSPSTALDPRVAALVGMAAMFGGASRALFASVAFAFESTRQLGALLPILGGGVAGYLVSAVFMRHGIMTEKIARRGVAVGFAYAADPLARSVGLLVARRTSVTLDVAQTAAEARARVGRDAAGEVWPVVEHGHVVGLIAGVELAAAPAEATVGDRARRTGAVIFEDATLREAAERMAQEGLDAIPVLTRSAPHLLVGVVTHADVVHVVAGSRRARAPVTPGLGPRSGAFRGRSAEAGAEERD